MASNPFSQQGDISLFKKESFCCASDLLCIEQEWITNSNIADTTPKIQAVQDFLAKVSSANTSTLSNSYRREKDAFLDISNLFSKFCVHITLSNREYSQQDLKKNNASNMTIASLGMGASDTWRGAPDARLRGLFLDNASESEVPVVCGRSRGTGDPEESNGTSSVCDAKLQIHKHHKAQLVKMCVVSAFIEKNLHCSLSPMVPAILIDTCKARIALYCAKNDVLMMSDKFHWRKGNDFNVNGFSVLWAMINHRYKIAAC